MIKKGRVEFLRVNRAVLNILSLLAVKNLSIFSHNSLQLVIKHKLLNNNINKLLLVVPNF